MKRAINIIMAGIMLLSSTNIVLASNLNSRNTPVDENESVLNEENKNYLSNLGVEIEKINAVELNSESEKHYIIDETGYFDVNDDGEIIRLSNFSRKYEKKESKYTENDLKKFVKEIENMYDLNNYELVISEEIDSDYWSFIWERKTSPSLYNKYNSIEIVVDRNNFKVVYLKKNDFDENIDRAVINEKEAFENLSIFLRGRHEVLTDKVSVKLEYIIPNDFWGNELPSINKNTAYLAYVFASENDEHLFYIDATNGQIIDGDMSMSTAEAAGCFGQTDASYYNGTKATLLAKGGMVTLGYNVTIFNSDTSTLRTKVLDFIDNTDSYGLYIRAHGSSIATDPYLATIKGATQTTIVKSSEIIGNWHFVFLDACYTGRSLWAEKFKITNTKANVAYLGWDGTVLTGNSALFADEFWPLVNTMSIRNAAVAAAAEVPGSGTTPIKFFGDTTYYGKVW